MESAGHSGESVFDLQDTFGDGMISMILDTISVWDDCILVLARDNKAKRMGDERGLELLQWRRMDGVVFQRQYHLVLWVRKLVACFG